MTVSSRPALSVERARELARAQMPAATARLETLVGHPSVAFPGFPAEPVGQAAQDLLGFVRDVGGHQARLVDLGAGYPAVVAEVPGPPGAPVVTLYAHYDVQPAPAEQGWTRDPWTLTRGEDGRLYGRGAADDKSGVVAHLATVAAYGGEPPVTLRLVFEGEEETLSHLGPYVRSHPEDFASDVFVVADCGNLEVGRPGLVTGLRGGVSLDVKVSTVEKSLHSGLFGGAAPDALICLIQLLATVWDESGATAIPGLHAFEWEGGELDETDFRRSAKVLDGVELQGSGPLTHRLWSRPAATVIGIDAPSVAESMNSVIPTATARLSVRIAPGADGDRELALVEEHLRTHLPRGAKLEITHQKVNRPYLASEGGAAVAAAEQALSDAFGQQSERCGGGGSIPLVGTFLECSPGAEAILWGAQDVACSRAHGPDESVDPQELENLVVAQILLLDRLAEAR